MKDVTRVPHKIATILNHLIFFLSTIPDRKRNKKTKPYSQISKQQQLASLYAMHSYFQYMQLIINVYIENTTSPKTSCDTELRQ